MKEAMVYYCHNYTANDLEKDIAQNGRSTLMEKIIAKSKVGNCNYANNNPKGY